MAKPKLLQRLKEALSKEPGIVTVKEKLGECTGFTTEQMNFLGLTKQDLKTLEKQGFALRGYSKRKNGSHTPVWILVGEGNSEKEVENVG